LKPVVLQRERLTALSSLAAVHRCWISEVNDEMDNVTENPGRNPTQDAAYNPTPPAVPAAPAPPAPYGTREEWRAWRRQQREYYRARYGLGWFGIWGWFWAVALILVGAYYLLVNLGLMTWVRGDLVWPLLLVVLGVLVLLSRFQRWNQS
jgi:hypothetical protein